MGAHARLNQIERKAVTLNSVLTIPGNDLTWSTVQLINGIAQGVTSTARIGRKCVVSAITIRWHYSFLYLLQITAGDPEVDVGV